MNRVIIWVFASFSLFVVLIAFIRISTNFRAPSAVEILLGSSTQCSYPCWHGIKPGEMTISQAENLLRRDKEIANIEHIEDDICWSVLTVSGWTGCISPQEGTAFVNHITFYPPETRTFQVSDAVTLFGRPTLATVCVIEGGDSREVTVQNTFADHVVVSASTEQFGVAPRLVFNMSVTEIDFYKFIEASPSYFEHSLSWRGFSSLLHS